MEYIIKESDVGRMQVQMKCECCGSTRTTIRFADVLGRVLRCDIGKKMKLIRGYWYVENDEQFSKRIKHEKNN